MCGGTGGPDAAPAAQATRPHPARTVLLVEDEEMVRLSTSRLLRALGWTVLTANDGAQGWAAFLQHAEDISVVVTDVRMPELDGITLAQRIHEHSPRCPVLIVSGYDRVDGASAATVPGAAFLGKPYSMAALAEALERLLAPGGSAGT